MQKNAPLFLAKQRRILLVFLIVVLVLIVILILVLVVVLVVVLVIVLLVHLVLIVVFHFCSPFLLGYKNSIRRNRQKYSRRIRKACIYIRPVL